MPERDVKPWRHEHVFGQDRRKEGERRTFWVVVLTAIMMLVEVAAGLVFGSMALLADGLHMASHATALGIAVLAYRLARGWAHDRRFAFGAGKINSLAGFASAVLLAGFALVMITESMSRLANPRAIDQALVVAVVGLVVNGVSAWILASTPQER
jgi:cation diffusion facilitator family transporter